MLRNHELRVRILRELIREVNLAKSTEREHGASSLLLEKATEKKIRVYYDNARIREYARWRNATRHFLFRRISKRVSIVKIRNVVHNGHMYFCSTAREASSKRREKFQPFAAEGEIHTCSRVCRVRSKMYAVESVFSESPNRTKMSEEKGSWISWSLYNCRIYIIMYIFFSRDPRLARVRFNCTLYTIYTRARCSILDSKKEAHKYRYYYCIV